MPKIGNIGKATAMTKWIVAAALTVIVAVGAALCFKAASAADAGAGIVTGASGHKASGHQCAQCAQLLTADLLCRRPAILHAPHMHHAGACTKRTYWGEGMPHRHLG